MESYPAFRMRRGLRLCGGLDEAKMREIDGQFSLRELLEQPVEKLDAEQRVELQAFFAHRIAGQNLRVGKTGVLRFANESSLREGAGQSACKRGFVIEHRTRQLAVHH